MTSGPHRTAAALGLAAALLAPSVEAHSPFPGLKGLYVGFLHPLTQPAQIMLLLTLGLLAGPSREAVRQPATVAAILGALIGLIGGASLGVVGDHGAVLSTLVMVGSAGVLTRRLPGSGVVTHAALAGLALGVASVPDPGGWRDMVITSVGSWFGVAFYGLLVIGTVAAVTDRWPGSTFATARQVAAAWLLAISGLYAALLWYTPAP